MRPWIRKQVTAAALGLALVEVAGAAPVAQPAGARAAAAIQPGVVDGRAAHELVASGVKVVDVRTAAEFAAGHVPGAVNIPYDQMAERHGELGPPPTALLLYCQTGRRSGIAGQVLRDKGYTVYDLQAYDRWLAAERAPR